MKNKDIIKLNAREFCEYHRKKLRKQLFNKMGEYKKKYNPLLKDIIWHLRHLLDNFRMSESLIDDMESLYLCYGGDD